MKVFMRSFSDDRKRIFCSWYDKNGRRYRYVEQNSFNEYYALNIEQFDNEFGFMGYARIHGFRIIDEAVFPHPKRTQVGIFREKNPEAFNSKYWREPKYDY